MKAWHVVMAASVAIWISPVLFMWGHEFDRRSFWCGWCVALGVSLFQMANDRRKQQGVIDG
jgi:hypothetical protein